jgi:branched-chain amino acid transport system substrate-binding protein
VNFGIHGRQSVARVAVAAAMLMLAACGNASTGSPANPSDPNGSGGDSRVPSSAVGVTDSEIRTTVIAPFTNPLGTDYEAYTHGIQAYFDSVNDGGGIYGRKLVIANKRDDQIVNNQSEVAAALDSDNSFALFNAPLLFNGYDSATPMYVWGLDASTNNIANVFSFAGYAGSYPNPVNVLVAKSQGASKIGLLSYNDPASGECAKQLTEDLKRWPVAELTFSDTSLSYGDFGGLPADVSKMVDAGVDFVYTCFDLNATVTLGQEMKKQGLDVPQLLLNAYDQQFVERNADALDGSIVMSSSFPMESEPRSVGAEAYVEWMGKAGYRSTDVSLAGWLNAALFHAGLVAAGPDFSQQKVIDATNSFTDWDADQLTFPVDWTSAHTTPPGLVCGAALKIAAGRLEPILGQRGAPFVCVSADTTDITSTPDSFFPAPPVN